MSKCRNKASDTKNGAGTFPGVAIDIADKEKTDRKLVKERTRAINNNPRNNDIDN